MNWKLLYATYALGVALNLLTAANAAFQHKLVPSKRAFLGANWIAALWRAAVGGCVMFGLLKGLPAGAESYIEGAIGYSFVLPPHPVATFLFGLFSDAALSFAFSVVLPKIPMPQALKDALLNTIPPWQSGDRRTPPSAP